MNQSSPAATGTAGVAITALVVVISTVSKRVGIDLSPQDQVSIAGGIVAGIHWLAQQYAARGAAKNPVVPAQQ